MTHVKMGVGSVALNVDFSEKIARKWSGRQSHGFCFEEVK